MVKQVYATSVSGWNQKIRPPERLMPTMRRTMRAWGAALLAVAMAGVLAAPVAAESDDAPPPIEADTGRYVVVMEEVPNVTALGRSSVTGAAAEARSVDLTDA